MLLHFHLGEVLGHFGDDHLLVTILLEALNQVRTLLALLKVLHVAILLLSIAIDRTADLGCEPYSS